MKRIKIVQKPCLVKKMHSMACGECQTSCQSACKTSCTVGNQPCENPEVRK
ncbi:MAG: six-cysteine ranthipeptide SCIFF [Eubacteriales bacterium]|nr:six-cysteine ranthipeptide SCIFF [Eubacteriales bacterium]